MPQSRNALIALGAFWLSLFVAPWLGVVFYTLNSKITYNSVWFEAIAMGMVLSMGRAVAAILSAVVTRFAVISRTPERWALIIAGLYLVDAPVRFERWHVSPTLWDHLWQAVDIVWPGVACLIAIAFMAYLRQKSAGSQVSQPAT